MPLEETTRAHDAGPSFGDQFLLQTYGVIVNISGIPCCFWSIFYVTIVHGWPLQFVNPQDPFQGI